MTRLPNTPAQPEHATDSTGVILGNADLVSERGDWTGPQEVAPLPSHEHSDALQSIETHAPRPYAYHDDTQLRRDLRGERYALWAVCIFGSLALAVAACGAVA